MFPRSGGPLRRRRRRAAVPHASLGAVPLLAAILAAAALERAAASGFLDNANSWIDASQATTRGRDGLHLPSARSPPPAAVEVGGVAAFDLHAAGEPPASVFEPFQLDERQGFTVAAWVQWKDSPSNPYLVMCDPGGLRFGLTGEDKPLSVWNGNTHIHSDALAESTKGWRFVAWTRDNNTGNIAFYSGGLPATVALRDTLLTTRTLSAQAASCAWGGIAGESGGPGLVASAAVIQNALSAADVNVLAGEMAPPSLPGSDSARRDAVASVAAERRLQSSDGIKNGDEGGVRVELCQFV